MQIKVYATIEVPDNVEYNAIEDNIDHYLHQLAYELDGEVTDLEIK